MRILSTLVTKHPLTLLDLDMTFTLTKPARKTFPEMSQHWVHSKPSLVLTQPPLPKSGNAVQIMTPGDTDPKTSQPNCEVCPDEKDRELRKGDFIVPSESARYPKAEVHAYGSDVEATGMEEAHINTFSY